MSNGYIRVDKERCVHLDDEFTSIEWDKNKTGGIPKRQDDKDHCITAFEYMNEESILYNNNNKSLEGFQTPSRLFGFIC